MAGIELRGKKDEAKVDRKKHHVLGPANLTVMEQEISGNINSVFINNLSYPKQCTRTKEKWVQLDAASSHSNSKMKIMELVP